VTELDTVARLIPAQAGYFKTRARYPCFLGAWGTGKSMTAIGKVVAECETYPGSLWAVWRKEFEDLKDSTCQDFEKYTGMRINSHRNVDFPNKSRIMFRHLEELNNIQNINLSGFWIEQAEELETDDAFFTLFGRLRRKGYPHFGMLTANAKGKNWIYKLFKAGGLVDAVKEAMQGSPELFPAGARAEDMVEVYEATTWDNQANLSQEFLASLKVLKAKKPLIYRRFVENSHEESIVTDVIVQALWVEAAQRRVVDINLPVRRCVSIDVARGGSDKSVFYALEMGGSPGKERFREMAWEEHETRNTMELVGRAQVFAEKHKTGDSYVVDEIGVGGGVVDRLLELKKDVVAVNAAAREGVPAGYLNRRAEILGNAGRIFEDGHIQLLPEDDDLAQQLTWTLWKPMKSNRVLQAQSKDDVREVYGRSPDNADALNNGLWGLPRTKVQVKRDGYSEKRSSYRYNPATA